LQYGSCKVALVYPINLFSNILEISASFACVSATTF
jgi:hypothetical protein